MNAPVDSHATPPTVSLGGAFMDAANGGSGAHTPVWFMRQAGRSLPEYRRIRGEGSILDAIKATDLDTMCGNVNWNAGEPQNPVPNVSKTPLVGGQWVKGEKWPFDLKIVVNPTASEITVQQDVAPITY